MSRYTFDFSYSNMDGFCILQMYHAMQEDIDVFPFHDYPKIDDLTIGGDYIQRFRIPDGVKVAVITCCALRELYVPDSVEYLNVSKNCLVQLELPENIEIVRASNNQLTSISFRKSPKKLNTLILHNNRLSELDFEAPPMLEDFDVRRNNHEMKLHPTLQKIVNGIADDEYDDEI